MGVVVKVAAGVMAVQAWTYGTWTAAVVTTVVALLCWAATRQALRYSLAVTAMWVVRAATVRASGLAEPGAVTDPDAPWRVWLNQRCAGCGY